MYEQISIYKMARPAFRDSVNNPSAVYRHFKGQADWDREAMVVLYLNSKSQILHQELHSVGTIDSAAVYPREIMKIALKRSASSIILIHNHPSGNPDPSTGDMQISRDITRVGDYLEIKLLDHIIIGRDCYYSLSEHGEMQAINLECARNPLGFKPQSG